ncbi:MAG: UvrD-helicase domain-containing protein [Pseudomonadota bacterium]
MRAAQERVDADARSHAAAPPAAPIYGPDRLPVRQQIARQMREDVALAVRLCAVSAPTPAQWEMILADHPATCVIAGAGSGKSTTLVLRVVLMVCYLRISPQEVTVVSFTRASCKELREKLCKALSVPIWNERLRPEDARAVEGVSAAMVKTFHAALARLARQAFRGVEWFDMIGSAQGGEDHAGPAFNSGSRLSERQQQLVLEAYRDLHAQDATFRGHVAALVKIESRRDLLCETAEKKYARSVLGLASARDLDVVKRINADWTSLGLWPVDGVDPEPVRMLDAEGQAFHANGRVMATGMPVYLSLDGRIDGDPLPCLSGALGSEQKPVPMSLAVQVRRAIVARFNAVDALDIRTRKSLDRLKNRVEQAAQTDPAGQAAPRLDVLLKGEHSESDLIEAFCAQGGFVESLGLEVARTLSDIAPTFKPHTAEFHFASALARFWPRFEQHLSQQAVPVMTFNRAFLQLSEDAGVCALTEEALRPFTHLLVDEFQDISPLIVRWVRALQRRQATLGKPPTLMAIGDDWQSIYAWRGSAPELFIDFGRHFPAHAALQGTGECRMMDNFRCVQPVIDDAQKLLAKVSVKTDKQAVPQRPTEAGDHGVRLLPGLNPDKKAREIAALIRQQLDDVNTLPRSDKNKVLVLARTNQALDKIKRALGGDAPGVAFHTFCTGSGCLDTVLQLRPPFAKHRSVGLRGVT